MWWIRSFSHFIFQWDTQCSSQKRQSLQTSVFSVSLGPILETSVWSWDWFIFAAALVAASHVTRLLDTNAGATNDTTQCRTGRLESNENTASSASHCLCYYLKPPGYTALSGFDAAAVRFGASKRFPMLIFHILARAEWLSVELPGRN